MFYERRLHATHELPPHCCPVCCCCPCHASFAPLTAATPICRLCCSWSIPFQHAPQHSAPAAVACLPLLPATAAGCMRFFAYFNASLSMQLTGTCHSGCHWRWRWRCDGDDGDDSATRRCHQLQQLLKCSYNFYADSQRAICSLSLPCSVSLPLSPLLSLSLFSNNFTIFTILLLLSRGVRLLLLLLLLLRGL